MRYVQGYDLATGVQGIGMFFGYASGHTADANTWQWLQAFSYLNSVMHLPQHLP